MYSRAPASHSLLSLASPRILLEPKSCSPEDRALSILAQVTQILLGALDSGGELRLPVRVMRGLLVRQVMKLISRETLPCGLENFITSLALGPNNHFKIFEGRGIERRVICCGSLPPKTC